MKFKILVLLLPWYIFQGVWSQEVKFSFQSGFGFYDMESFKSITREINEQLPFEAKIMSNYPPYIFYQPGINFCRPNFEYGFSYLFQTTGSRISSKDYSGEYAFDSKITSHSPGILLRFVSRRNDVYNMAFGLHSGGNFSRLNMVENLQIGNESVKSEYKFHSTGIFIQPGISIIFPVRQFAFEGNLSYHKEVTRKEYTRDGTGNQIGIKNEIFEPDVWDGLRLGITVTYSLGKSKMSMSSTTP